MSAITHLIIWVVGTFLIYLWYRHWIKELKENESYHVLSNIEYNAYLMYCYDFKRPE